MSRDSYIVTRVVNAWMMQPYYDGFAANHDEIEVAMTLPELTEMLGAKFVPAFDDDRALNIKRLDVEAFEQGRQRGLEQGRQLGRAEQLYVEGRAELPSETGSLPAVHDLIGEGDVVGFVDSKPEPAPPTPHATQPDLPVESFDPTDPSVTSETLLKRGGIRTMSFESPARDEAEADDDE